MNRIALVFAAFAILALLMAEPSTAPVTTRSAIAATLWRPTPKPMLKLRRKGERTPRATPMITGGAVYELPKSDGYR